MKSAKRGEGKFAQPSAAKRRGKGGRKTAGEDSKSERIRELLGSGMSAADIAKEVGASVNLVYVVKSKVGGRRQQRPHRRAASRRGGEGRNEALESVVEALRQGEREKQELRRVLEQIRELVHRLP